MSSKEKKKVGFSPAVAHDWRLVMTASEAEKEFSAFKFKGPGWYLNVDECMLVVPSEIHEGPYKDNREYCVQVWKQTWPENTKFVFYYYGCGFEYTIFSVCAVAPTRQDDW